MSLPDPKISFDNTEYAFEYKSDSSLRKARFLFSLMSYPWLVALGTRLTPWAIRVGLPIKGLLRGTLFAQFVGGESLASTKVVATSLSQYGVQVILDYGVEGKEGEENFDLAVQEFTRVIDYAASVPSIPFMSIKVTGFARFGLLEHLHQLMITLPGQLLERYHAMLEQLDPAVRAEWQRIYDRVQHLCTRAARQQVGVSIDAEESWIQEPIDALAMLMMEQFNGSVPVVYNTVQLYRHDRYLFLQDCTTISSQRKYILAVKLVRGAYMEKERKRALEKNYPSPIHANKQEVDKDYDQALQFCIDRIDQLAVIVASHNEKSNLLAAQLMWQKGLSLRHPHIHWSQLYGMSDNITFNLSKAGASVSKYLPFGPIEDVIPYLMRRAQENTSVKGQTGRELGLIQKELDRRKHLA
ncbi:MAG: proline dehydrogenase family protein [Sphingomonadales bacterium]